MRGNVRINFIDLYKANNNRDSYSAADLASLASQSQSDLRYSNRFQQNDGASDEPPNNQNTQQKADAEIEKLWKNSDLNDIQKKTIRNQTDGADDEDEENENENDHEDVI